MLDSLITEVAKLEGNKCECRADRTYAVRIILSRMGGRKHYVRYINEEG
jgi:hypothetical protein